MLSLNEARRVIRAAEKKAQQLGCAANIAVVDEGGHVMAQIRMDGAWLAGVEAAACKAYTARAFDAATRDMIEHVRTGGVLAGIHRGADKRIMIAAGGVPLRYNGQVCGAIGVSGCSSSEDGAIAMAGANALLNGHANAAASVNGNSESERREFSPSQIGRLGNRGDVEPHAYGDAEFQDRNLSPSQIGHLGNRGNTESNAYDHSEFEDRNFYPSQIGRLGNRADVAPHAYGEAEFQDRNLSPSQIGRLGNRSVMSYQYSNQPIQ
jgi:uncharacterized protein GlcG (DUF336 family)